MKRTGNRDDTFVLAYSTDPQPEKRCATCKQLPSNCSCKSKSDTANAKPSPIIRFERKGRGGKSVTILGKLPAGEALLKKLCKYLKQSLGTGGTFYVEGTEGIVEIQGDCRQELPALLAKYK